MRRWDVAKLQGDCVDVRGRETARGRYLSGLMERLNESWDVQGSMAEKWDVLKGALCGEAKAVLGYEDRKRPGRARQLLGQALMRRTGCMLYGSVLKQP